MPVPIPILARAGLDHRVTVVRGHSSYNWFLKERIEERSDAAGNCADPRALVPTAAGAGVAAAVAINVRLSLEDADRAVADARAPASEVR